MVPHMCLAARATRALSVSCLLTLALAAAAPARAADPATDAAPAPNSRAKGVLGWILASAPRKAQPWHRYGDLYASGGVGLSMYRDHTDSNDDGSLSAIDARDSGAGWHVSGGFAGRYVGAEVGWMDLGSSKFDATASGAGYSWTTAGDVSAKVEASGWTASALLRIPVKPRWVMLARVGVLGWTSTETFTETAGATTYTTVEKDTDTTPLYGVGFEYDIYSLDHFWLRTEFTRAQVDADELPVMGINGSLVFHY